LLQALPVYFSTAPSSKPSIKTERTPRTLWSYHKKKLGVLLLHTELWTTSVGPVGLSTGSIGIMRGALKNADTWTPLQSRSLNQTMMCGQGLLEVAQLILTVTFPSLTRSFLTISVLDPWDLTPVQHYLLSKTRSIKTEPTTDQWEDLGILAPARAILSPPCFLLILFFKLKRH
jgi:hypothetical protein